MGYLKCSLSLGSLSKNEDLQELSICKHGLNTMRETKGLYSTRDVFLNSPKPAKVALYQDDFK